MPTLDSLTNSMTRFPRSLSAYKPLIVRNIEVIIAPGIKTITFRGTVDSETDKGTKYLTSVQFHDVEFSKEKMYDKLTGGKEQFTQGVINGVTWYFQLPNLNTNRAVLKCQCPDFRFSFEKQLFDAKSLIGNWRKYTRVQGSKRPPRNPNNVPGYCKHVFSLVNALLKSGRITK